MDLRLNTFWSDLESATELTDLQGLTERLRDRLGVLHVVYHWVSSEGEQFGFGTYSRDWAQRYIDMDYLRIDPVVLGCSQRFHPVDWKALDWSGKAARALCADAVTFGVGHQGYSIPMRGPNGQFALFTVSDDRDDAAWSAFTATRQRDLVLISHFLNQKALDLRAGRVPAQVRPLSPREVDALTYLAVGYGRAQVAGMLAISEHTLRAYIESARAKLGASNTVHAVARAVQEGFIVVGGAAPDAAGGWPPPQAEPDHRAMV